ncbi:aminotransferase class I/II-fold pyridoxal phosphate-dependent enzyme [Paenibacillus sp. GCM10012307]|uniref:Aminotransferase class I/II-fold pyridoxal phosphate-dependent enzyme n=1 Tax=Paenibacillus roseus TaxID=2798579 RepID=A0A934J1Y7_9BACL|nr:aminotransferase class I/II-fold pyridoxal phosphate-dependent enzyme [Paenibacillus roseus]MBJ6361305.1 aminotransferase class I/II-fold pyridoxal phosphate-dependent enzyme [Paenibacillus roseus]
MSSTSLFRAPLYEILVKHADSAPGSLHVPGHQYGKALGKLSASVREDFARIMRMDVTELSVTDDLHHPEGAILEAQRLAADLYGAEETYFMVGGSTAGNLALLLSHCKRDGILITQRNVHKSILNGLALSGAHAVFAAPQIDRDSGLATLPSLEQLEEALIRYSEAEAVMLCNPNYYGMGASLKDYVELVHRYHKPLFVDEAHGAHYGLHPEFPTGALAAGADAVVQSAHKTLPALTMGAMLHVQGERIDRAKLRGALTMIQSSSPSYPIMASLDLARAACMEQGPSLFDQALEAAAYIRDCIASKLPWVSLLPLKPESQAYNQADPLRITLSDRTGTLSGYDWLKELEAYGWWAEMADSRHCVLLIGISCTRQEVNRIVETLIEISARYELDRKAPQAAADLSAGHWNWGELPLSGPIRLPTPAEGALQTEMVPLQEAEGRSCAEMITPYPPGIPILYPGECINNGIIAAIRELAEHGAKFQGAADPSLMHVKVYRH